MPWDAVVAGRSFEAFGNVDSSLESWSMRLFSEGATSDMV
jgi:hypothetical protein